MNESVRRGDVLVSRALHERLRVREVGLEIVVLAGLLKESDEARNAVQAVARRGNEGLARDPKIKVLHVRREGRIVRCAPLERLFGDGLGSRDTDVRDLRKLKVVIGDRIAEPSYELRLDLFRAREGVGREAF